MTRKNYIAMAEALKATQPHVDTLHYLQWLACVRAVASVFARDNARFDRDCFLSACGV